MEINNKNTAPTDEKTASQADGPSNTGENAQAQGGETGTNDGEQPIIEEGTKGEQPGATGDSKKPAKELTVERHKKPTAAESKAAKEQEDEDEAKKNKLKGKKTLDTMPGKPSASAPANNEIVGNLADKAVVRFYNKGTKREQKLPGKTFAKLYSKAPDNFTILED